MSQTEHTKTEMNNEPPADQNQGDDGQNASTEHATEAVVTDQSSDADDQGNKIERDTMTTESTYRRAPSDPL